MIPGPCAAVFHWAALRAALPRADFLAAVGGPAVLIRLDERGGRDEPVPWAFYGRRDPGAPMTPWATRGAPALSSIDSSEESDREPSSPWSVPGEAHGAGERGSKRPSAFDDREHTPTQTDLARPFSSFSTESDDAALMPGPARAAALRPDAPTDTGPAWSLPVPPAREQATVHVVPSRDARLGRDAACDVVIAERSVSKRHARIAAADGPLVAGPGGLPRLRFTLHDDGSQNGTLLNGNRLSSSGAPLSSGDYLELGDVAFVFLDAVDFHEHLPLLAG